MKAKTICAVIGVASFLIALGIVGGVEHGEPLINLIWAFVCVGITWLSIVVAGRTA